MCCPTLRHDCGGDRGRRRRRRRCFRGGGDEEEEERIDPRNDDDGGHEKEEEDPVVHAAEAAAAIVSDELPPGAATGASALADVADMDGIPLALSTEDDHIRADDDGVHRPVWDDEDDKVNNEEDGAPRGRRWRGRPEKDDDEEWRPKEGEDVDNGETMATSLDPWRSRRRRDPPYGRCDNIQIDYFARGPTDKSTTSRGDRLR